MAAARSDWPAQRIPAATNKQDNFELGNEAIQLVLAICRYPRQLLHREFFGNFLRFVFAKSRSCFLLIDFAICLDAPLSDDFDRSPRFAASAAPAAICCFFDFAGIILSA